MESSVPKVVLIEWGYHSCSLNGAPRIHWDSQVSSDYDQICLVFMSDATLDHKRNVSEWIDFNQTRVLISFSILSTVA